MPSHVNNAHKNKFPEQSQNSLDEKAIYMLQTINVDNHQYSIFYDTSCSEMVSRYKAVKSLRTRAIQEHAGPITIGVGNSHIVSQHGIYKISLPLFNGENANLSGVCMDKITEFPMYPLERKSRRGYKECLYKN